VVHGCQVLAEEKYNQKSLLSPWGHSVDARRNTEWETEVLVSLQAPTVGCCSQGSGGIKRALLKGLTLSYMWEGLNSWIKEVYFHSSSPLPSFVWRILPFTLIALKGKKSFK